MTFNANFCSHYAKNIYGNVDKCSYWLNMLQVLLQTLYTVPILREFDSLSCPCCDIIVMISVSNATDCIQMPCFFKDLECHKTTLQNKSPCPISRCSKVVHAAADEDTSPEN